MQRYLVVSNKCAIFTAASRKLEGTTVRLLAGDLWVPLYFFFMGLCPSGGVDAHVFVNGRGPPEAASAADAWEG